MNAILKLQILDTFCFQLLNCQSPHNLGPLVIEVGDLVLLVLIVYQDRDVTVFICEELGDVLVLLELPDCIEQVVPPPREHEVEVHIMLLDDLILLDGSDNLLESRTSS